MDAQYLVVHQTRDQAPSDYENLLADGIEKCFGMGLQDLDAICARLNTDCVPAPRGQAWTPELFQAEMRRLGA